MYGLRVFGLDEVTELDATVFGTVGDVEIRVGQVDVAGPDLDGPDPAGPDLAAPDPEAPDRAARPVGAPDRGRCVRLLPDGRRLEMLQAPGTATFFGPPLEPGLLAHPYLGAAAALFSRWSGREAFHAGAFVVDGRAWVVVGERTAGKSSLLTTLAARGLPVLSDDIVVTDGSSVYAGPRCIDLREPVPGSTLHTIPARLDTRLRVALAPVCSQARLGGWLFLGWGAQSMTPVVPERLLGRLAAGRTWRQLPSDPVTLLRLATVPAWDLIRPRDWAAVPSTVDRLLRTLDVSGAIGEAA